MLAEGLELLSLLLEVDESDDENNRREIGAGTVAD